MTSRRVLLFLLVFVLLDFAVPYEPTARGWYEVEDEEESVQPERRAVERPRVARARPARPADTGAERPRPAPGTTARPVTRPEAPVTRLARADTSSPPASPDAH